ncbi:MAG: hypothetical protein JRN35_05640 [Nitrososphaerota archaeon]|nr:hypothetical protein [Nitrososphaerota archaeon]
MSIDLPKYRLKNGRTLAAQEDLLARDPKLARNLFEDPESELAQKEQHKLLLELSKQGPLWMELKKGVQKEPIVLNGDGLVINGNRRLCTMREFLDRDGGSYSSFRNLRVVVLPEADEQQVFEFEVKEQIKPDVKDPYDWIQMAKMIQRGMRELNLNEKRLAAIYEEPPQRIRELLQLLHAADEYLADRGKPNQYNLVERNEFYFRKIAQGRKKLRQEDDREAFTSISYLLMENPQKGMGRLYEVIPEVQENLQPIVEAIQAEIKLSPSTAESLNEAAALLGAPKVSIAAAITDAAQDPAKREEILGVVYDQLEMARNRERRRANSDYAIRKVRQASALLLDARNGLGDESRVEGMSEHLLSIEKSVTDLREQLKKRA